MSGQPWFKFFPASWRSDPALRTCSIAARGLWIELLCLAHENTPRGHVLVKASPVSDVVLAGLCGIPPKDFGRLLRELELAGVFSRTPQGTIYSRRMVRDEEKAARDQANGRTGGNPNVRQGLTPGLTQTTSAGVNPTRTGLGKPYYPLSSPGENLSVGATVEGTDEDAPFGREERH